MKKLLLTTLAVAALSAGSTQAATIYAQNFDGGLNANESVGGKFSVGKGTMGHQSGGYVVNETSFYQVTLDLRNVSKALLSFDFSIGSEYGYDGFNLAYGSGGAFTQLLTPTSGMTYYGLSGRARNVIGASGASGDQSGLATFDLSALAGQIVDLRFQFASDYAAGGRGVIMDNLLVTDGMPTSAVPEPATWAMLITGFGLAGGAIRARRRGLATAAA